nr:hypothetical protein CPGR_03083 [Mycolicibacterium malmesburyense]
MIPIRLRCSRSRVRLVFRRPQRRDARGHRVRDICRVEVVAGPEVESRLCRIGGQHAVETACARPQFTPGLGPPGPHADGPRSERRQEEGRERQRPHRRREPPAKDAERNEQQRDRVGHAHPPLSACLHQKLVVGPFPDGLVHVGLGLGEPLAGPHGLVGLELFARARHPQRRPDRQADRIDLTPLGALGLTANAPVPVCHLTKLDQPALREMEQRRGDGLSGHRLRADVLDLNRADALGRGVLQREARRPFDGAATPQKTGHPGRRGQRRHPQRTRQRVPENAIPSCYPRHRRARGRGHVDARAHGDRSPRHQGPGRESHRVALNRQLLARCARAVADGALHVGNAAG